MIKFKKKMKYLKGFILYAILCVFAFMPFMSFNVNAWSLDSNGNLISDNLIDASNREGRYWVTTQSDISATINDLDLGTYTISCDLTPIFIDNGYNVDDCFFALQLVGGQYTGDGLIVGVFGFTSLNETKRGSLTFTKESYTNYEFRLWGFGNHNGGNHGIGRISNIMLNTGSSALSYEPYGVTYYSQENYNNVAQDLLGGLEGYDAIDLYYSDSITYVSTDNGQTFTNANNQDVNNNYVYGLFDRNNLIIDKDNPWNANAIYMVRVNFSQPLFLWRLQILNSAKPTTFLKIVCNDLTITNFNYFVDTEQGNTSYIISDNIFQTCDSVEFYFKINQYVSGSSTSWILDYKGYNVGIDSYNEGYRDGQDSMSTQIDDLKSNINILKQQITSLNEQLSNNFGWQSLFFGMADTPLYTVSQMLGFEVLGVNLFNAFIGFITVLAILWVLKRLVK